MAAEGYKRKLTAIMSADVAGYSRLMGGEVPKPNSAHSTLEQEGGYL